MIKQIASDLIEQAGLGIPGKTLFIHNAPERIKSCILVIDGFDGTLRDEYLPGLKRTEFKVIIRNSDYQQALTIAKQVVDILDLHRFNAGNLQVLRMRATHDPIAFPVPSSDVLEVSLNMWAAFVEQ